MELEHSFSVPVPEDRAWDVLLDVERVAPCMPGATLQSIDGDEIHGSIRVKVGPITMVYTGTARFTERDPAAHVITLEASGKETRGAGTASAKVRSMLEGMGDQTHVVVHTSLNVTGKPAQFGRGVLTEVGAKLIGMFADNLAAMLAAESSGDSQTVTDGNNVGNVIGLATPGPDVALPIDVLNLQPRVWNSLHKEGIQTVGDLTRRTEQQLLAVENIGPASVADIRDKLADRGLSLADSGDLAPVASLPDPAANGDRSHEAADADAAESSQAGATGPEVAPVTPLRPHRERTEPPARPAWQPQGDAIDLLEVAGLPVLKRAVPAAVGVIAVIAVFVGIRRRRIRRG